MRQMGVCLPPEAARPNKVQIHWDDPPVSANRFLVKCRWREAPKWLGVDAARCCRKPASDGAPDQRVGRAFRQPHVPEEPAARAAQTSRFYEAAFGRVQSRPESQD